MTFVVTSWDPHWELVSRIAFSRRAPALEWLGRLASELGEGHVTIDSTDDRKATRVACLEVTA